jgi:hypothetical protein
MIGRPGLSGSALGMIFFMFSLSWFRASPYGQKNHPSDFGAAILPLF